MNYIFDIILNFSDCSNYYEFYEWDLNDEITFVDEIPVFKISSNKMYDIMNYKIKISSSMLKKICNKTHIDGGIIKYGCLVTDSFKVLGLIFNDEGYVNKISSLLLDEEDEVISSCLNISISNFKVEKILEYNNSYLLTRREKLIQKELLLNLNKLYCQKDYDEIDYFYKELFNNELDINSEYNFLVNDITNNFDIKYEKIYNLMRLTE